MIYQLRPYALVALLFFSLSCTEKKQEPFSFVQLCDTQLGMAGYEHDIQTFRQAVKQINALNPDFAVICGDLISDPADSTYAAFKSIVEGFKIPCHVASGNHDVGNEPTDSTLQYYREIMGPDYFDFQHKGHSFVFVNTQLWKVDVPQESAAHHRWFQDALAANQNPKFVIGHYPLYTEHPDEEEHYFNIPKELRKQLLKSFTNHQVVAYLTGHTHQLTVNQYENIQLVSGETTSKNFDGRPLGFRVWQVTEDTIRHEFVPLELTGIQMEEDQSTGQ